MSKLRHLVVSFGKTRRGDEWVLVPASGSSLSLPRPYRVSPSYAGSSSDSRLGCAGSTAPLLRSPLGSVLAPVPAETQWSQGGAGGAGLHEPVS